MIGTRNSCLLARLWNSNNLCSLSCPVLTRSTLLWPVLSCPVPSYRALFCHISYPVRLVLSCSVMLCPVLSCPALSILPRSVPSGLSCHVMSRSWHVMSSHGMSCHGMAWNGMAWHVIMSQHVMARHGTSWHVMTRHVMSCHVMSCQVMSCSLLF